MKPLAPPEPRQAVCRPCWEGSFPEPPQNSRTTEGLEALRNLCDDVEVVLPPVDCCCRRTRPEKKGSVALGHDVLEEGQEVRRLASRVCTQNCRRFPDGLVKGKLMELGFLGDGPLALAGLTTPRHGRNSEPAVPNRCPRWGQPGSPERGASSSAEMMSWWAAGRESSSKASTTNRTPPAKTARHAVAVTTAGARRGIKSSDSLHGLCLARQE